MQAHILDVDLVDLFGRIRKCALVREDVLLAAGIEVLKNLHHSKHNSLSTGRSRCELVAIPSLWHHRLYPSEAISRIQFFLLQIALDRVLITTVAK